MGQLQYGNPLYFNPEGTNPVTPGNNVFLFPVNLFRGGVFVKGYASIAAYKADTPLTDDIVWIIGNLTNQSSLSLAASVTKITWIFLPGLNISFSSDMIVLVPADGVQYNIYADGVNFTCGASGGFTYQGSVGSARLEFIFDTLTLGTAQTIQMAVSCNGFIKGNKIQKSTNHNPSGNFMSINYRQPTGLNSSLVFEVNKVVWINAGTGATSFGFNSAGFSQRNGMIVRNTEVLKSASGALTWQIQGNTGEVDFYNCFMNTVSWQVAFAVAWSGNIRIHDSRILLGNNLVAVQPLTALSNIFFYGNNTIQSAGAFWSNFAGGAFPVNMYIEDIFNANVPDNGNINFIATNGLYNIDSNIAA